MADINHIITLGIGVPGDIEHFILFGLNGVALSVKGHVSTAESLVGAVLAVDALAAGVAVSEAAVGAVVVADG